MVQLTWDDRKYQESTKKKALNGVEEIAKTLMATQAKEDCPVDTGTLRGTIGTERDDKELCIYLGCGGPAKSYALRQELDRSLNHTVGKAGFIRDSVELYANQVPAYIEKHIK